MQNFKPELLEGVPRPDSIDLVPKMRKKEGVIAEGGKKLGFWGVNFRSFGSHFGIILGCLWKRYGGCVGGAF